MDRARNFVGIEYVVWELTLRCDLACGHCGSRAGRARKDELTTDEALDVVRQLGELGVREVTLIGGEAYLRDDWHVIARAIRQGGMRCTMTTGGRQLTMDRVRLAKEAGIESISVSLDGLEAAHDRQRGVAGSFRAALDAIRRLRAVELPVAVNTQINRCSSPDLEGLYDLLVREKVRAWQVQLTVAMGRAVERSDWLLQPYDMLDVIPRLAALARRGQVDGVTMWPGNNIGYFGPHEADLRGRGRPDHHATGCSAGLHVLGIEADGSIKGCPSLPSKAYVGGRVRERSIRSIWETSKELRLTRDRTTADLWGFCKGCYYAEICHAGCTWTAHVLFGRPGNNPYCHHRALQLARNGQRERLVPVAPAPGEPFDHGLFELIVEPLDAVVPGSDDVRGGPARRLPILG